VDVVLRSIFFLFDDFKQSTNLVSCVHAYSFLVNKFIVKFTQIFKSVVKEMVAEEFTVFALSENWKFFITELTLDDSWLLVFEDGESIHIEVAAFQTMNTFSDFLTWHVLAFSFVLQKLVEDRLELVDQFDTVKEDLELIDSHHWNRCDFFIFR